MTIKVVEYVHEYPEKSYIPLGSNDDPNGTARETFYAVGEKDTYDWRSNSSDKWDSEIVRGDKFSFLVAGTDMRIYDRNTILGYIGLLNKLLEEFPEDGE
jgi:hypothetical protein